MIWEFSVTYRVAAAAPLASLTVLAADEKQARAMLPEDLEFVRISQLRPSIAPNQWTFNREEFAHLLRSTVAKVENLQATGELPRVKNGRPIYTKAMLETFIARTMGVELKEVA
jgi:hypothetical protein